MKMLGKDFKEFMGADWTVLLGIAGVNWIYEEESGTIDGDEVDYFENTEAIRDDSIIVIKSGLVYQEENYLEGTSYTLQQVAKKWLAKRDNTTFVASVPNDAVDAFKAFCKANKIKL